MSLEDQVRRQMEESCRQEASGNCPVEGEIDVALSSDEKARATKKAGVPLRVMVRTANKKTNKRNLRETARRKLGKPPQPYHY